MVEDKPEDIEPSPDSGRARRAPPTIDLEPSEVSSATRNMAGEASPNAAQVEPAPAEATPPPEDPSATPVSTPISAPISPPISPWVIAPVSGAVAAALVIGVGWMLGWPPVQAPTAASSVNAAVVDDLTTRLAGIESRVNKPAIDSATAARADALEKSLSSLRGELNVTRAQSEKLAAAVGEIKSAPGGSVATSDIAAINERIAGLERAARAQSADNAPQGAKPADDVALRRVVVASLLDVSVRTGDPYPAALAAAKSLAANPDALKPLDDFAAKGVPNAASLSRELLALVPKLSPPAPESSTTGAGLVDRLQAGAAKLVRIERTDAVGNDRGAVVARVTAAALRNDSNEARRELKTLEPADRAAAQAWIDKADARDAALATSRQFAAEAMTALAQPAQ
jgi:hypothetical protein